MKRNVRGWIAALCCTVMVAGCPDDVVVVDDAGPGVDSSTPGDGGDACEGLPLCTTLGTSCDGDELVTCATNADGCRIEVRDDCGDDDQVCNVTGSTASCIDPCLLIPTAMRCDAAGRSCDGDSLEICTANVDGCFVLEATDCAATPDGTCGMGDTMLQCLLPVDPCAGIPAADRCTVEGTSCTDDDLVTCAPNSLGCLVITTTDCTTRTGGTCDDTTDPAAATCAATDACVGLEVCAAAGAECDGPTLVTCAPDAFGCLVETTEDCTATTFGFCDTDATPVDACSTAATDPCMGVTECGTAPGRTCSTDGTTLTVCEANAFGCFVGVDTTCATGDVCDATGTMAMCVTPAPDLCPEALPTVLDCATGTLTSNTMGGTTGRSAYAGCSSYTSYSGAERIWRFLHSGTTPVEVEIVATRAATTGDFDLYAWEDDGTATCTATTSLSCLDASTGSNDVETVEFVAAPGDAAYVAYDIFSTATPRPTTDFTLAITCTPIVCGDGIVNGAETCDDANTTAGDGCSATCAVEAGFSCTSAEPSVCALMCGNGAINTGEGCDDGNTTSGDGCSSSCAIESPYVCWGTPSTCATPAANATCATATAISSSTTLVAENTFRGGARPSATGCGNGSGTSTLYYAITVPGSAIATVRAAPTGTPTWDALMFRTNACSDAACVASVDSGGSGTAETMTLSNSTAAPVTHLVGVRSYGAGGGTFDLTVTISAVVCGDGVTQLAEACDDGNTTSGDGCSSSCVIEPNYVCTGAPSTCELAAPNATCGGALPIGAGATGDLTMGAGARPTGTSCGSSVGPVLYYSVSVPANSSVLVTGTPTGTTAWDLTLRSLADCAGACLSHRDTAAAGAAETLSFVNTTGAAVARTVAVGADSSSLFGTFDLTATTTALAANSSCAAATAVSSATTLTAQDLTIGGSPVPTSCGGGSGTTALYYAVSVPAYTSVAVTATPTGTPAWDIIVGRLASCASTSCSSTVDSGAAGDADTLTIHNTTAAAVTENVLVRSYSSTYSTFDIAFAYSPVPYIPTSIAAACVTTGTWTSLTRSSSANDATTPITALPFPFTYFGGAVTHFSMNDNGMAQLWSSSSGTPSGAWTNTALPNSSTPNGVLAAFWDDLYLGTGHELRVQTTGTAGSQVFVLEWLNARADSSSGPLMTVQAHLVEATNVIEYHYCSITGTSAVATGSGATIGIENLTGTVGVQTSRDTADAVMTGSGFRYTPNP